MERIFYIIFKKIQSNHNSTLIHRDILNFIKAFA